MSHRFSTDAVQQRDHSCLDSYYISKSTFGSLKLPAELCLIHLGGAWGSNMKAKDARSKWKQSWTDIFMDDLAWAARDIKWPDQHLLARFDCMNLV